MRVGYNELYGIPLDEYIVAHDTSLEDLIQKSTIDMEIMQQHLKRIMQEADWYKNPLVDIINSNIRKKYKHIEYLKNWDLE